MKHFLVRLQMLFLLMLDKYALESAVSYCSSEVSDHIIDAIYNNNEMT